MSTMEASRPSSPDPDQVQKSSDDESECQKSPTTVIEADTLYFTSVNNNNNNDLAIAFPDSNYKEVGYQSSYTINKEEGKDKLRRKQRERRRYMCVLPTIQEVPEDEEKKEGDEKSLGFALLMDDDDLSEHIRKLSTPVNSENILKEVQIQIDAGSQRAAKGNEEKALKIYKDCIFTLKQEVNRISEQIERLAMREPKFEKTASYIILQEEWAESALVIAKVRTMMATIFERQEDYDEALRCSQEARAIYRRQADFDKRHQKKGSCVHEMEISMENMMEQIEEARESEYIRKSLHQTVERIREKIEATADETSRGFLYEDIFDKLSTVLSLEVMYLGETHPQISSTKGVLSMFYSEVKQHEKALRAMNEAVLICEMALGDKHPQTGTKYQEAAKLYERIEGEDNSAKAIDLYEKAIDTLGVAEGNVSDRLCSSLNGVAVLYIQKRCYAIAIKKLKTAIHISEENYRERSDDTSTEPIQLWLNLAECQALKGDPALATEASKHALRIQRDKRNFHDSSRKGPESIPNLISNSKIASTMKMLGKSLAAETKFKQAYDSFTEALSILNTDLKKAKEMVKFNPTIDLPSQEDAVASALYDLAMVKQADSEYAEARKLYRESLELRKQSDEKRIIDERTNFLNCAMCLVGIGSLELIEKEDSEAFKSFNHAIYYAKKHGITDSDPIAKMLWGKSRIAANNMTKEQSPLVVGLKTKNIERDHAEISRLEKKEKEVRESRDFESCARIINIVIKMRRTILEKTNKEEQSKKAKRQLAVSLITKGEISLIRDSKKEATECINEASGLLKSTGLNQNDHCFREIEKIYDKIRKMKRRKKISDTLWKMTRRSDTTAEFSETMAEF